MIAARSNGHFDYEGCIATMLWEVALSQANDKHPETNFMRMPTSEEQQGIYEEAEDIYRSCSRSFCDYLVVRFLEDEWYA